MKQRDCGNKHFINKAVSWIEDFWASARMLTEDKKIKNSWWVLVHGSMCLKHRGTDKARTVSVTRLSEAFMYIEDCISKREIIVDTMFSNFFDHCNHELFFLFMYFLRNMSQYFPTACVPSTFKIHSVFVCVTLTDSLWLPEKSFLYEPLTVFSLSLYCLKVTWIPHLHELVWSIWCQEKQGLESKRFNPGFATANWNNLVAFTNYFNCLSPVPSLKRRQKSVCFIWLSLSLSFIFFLILY